MKFTQMLIFGIFLFYHSVAFSSTTCRFGLINGDLNRGLCNNTKVNYAQEELKPYISSENELRVAVAGDELIFEVYLLENQSKINTQEIAEFNLFYIVDEGTLNSKTQFDQVPSTYGKSTLLRTSLSVPKNAHNLEIYANFKDQTGKELWLNGGDSSSNIKFLVTQGPVLPIVLEAPLEKSIYKSTTDITFPPASFVFEYDLQRATDLGVPHLWYKSGETRNAVVSMDYFDQDGFVQLSLEVTFRQLPLGSRVSTLPLPLFDKTTNILFKVYSKNYSNGCGYTPKDFSGCDDNWQMGHKIDL